VPSPTTVLLRTQTDERLVGLARAGSERAFEAIVERYRRPLMRACRRVLPEARAEDAVQQTLMAAWAGLARGDDVRDLRSWLYRIAHNTALNQLRVSGYDYDELHGLLYTGPAPEEELERREVARRTLTGLAALPERQREALLQIAIQGRGQEEVAHALGISEPAVRQLVHRARTRLRAAATAVTPMPLAAWLADLGSRADIVASGSGVAATVAKVGAVVVLAGGAAAGPAVVDRLEHGGRSPRPPASAPHGAAVADAPSARRVATATATATPSHPALVPVASRQPSAGGAQPAPSTHADRHESTRHESRHGSTGDDGQRGSSGGDDSSGSRHRGSSGDDSSSPRLPSSGDDGSQATSGDDSSGSSSGDDSADHETSGSGSSGGDAVTVESDSGESNHGGWSGGDSAEPSAPTVTTPPSGSSEPVDHLSGD
jgi:RNA polymerase sigma factor (sigma-70 family)